MDNDLISRQAALEIKVSDGYNVDGILYVPFKDVYKHLKTISSVHPEQKTGYWIGEELGECSNCGHSGCASDIWNGCEQMFCPNCGAKMEGEG